jgi:hypothetical protein
MKKLLFLSITAALLFGFSMNNAAPTAGEEKHPPPQSAEYKA